MKYSKELPYIRVATSYYKIVDRPLISKDTLETLVPWRRQTIIEDLGAKVLERIPKYDGFCNIPSHLDFKPVVGSFLNRYNPITPMLNGLDFDSETGEQTKNDSWNTTYVVISGSVLIFEEAAKQSSYSDPEKKELAKEIPLLKYASEEAAHTLQNKVDFFEKKCPSIILLFQFFNQLINNFRTMSREVGNTYLRIFVAAITRPYHQIKWF